MDCKAPGCSSRIFSGLLCRKHYERDRLETADPCSISGCKNRSYRGVLCATHYRSHLLSQRPTCVVPGCGGAQKNLTSGLCGKHESRMRAHAAFDSPRPLDWGAREDHSLYKTWVWHKRGVGGMCAEWKEDFWEFVSAVGVKPEGHTLRRHNPKAPLGPGNWHWKPSTPSTDKAAYQRAWRSQNPDRAKHHDLKKSYGIGLDEYQAMFDRQGGVCAICKGKESTVDNNGAPRRMPVDHCHKTGKIRGLLCTQCNRGLGMFGDSADRLRAAAEYVDLDTST